MDYLRPLRYGALRSTTDHYKSALKIEEPEDFEIQGILSKDLKDKWSTEHAWFQPIPKVESPESPIEAMTSPRYSPISPALPRHSQHTPISNCSPISSNPSRHSQHTPISNCSPISSSLQDASYKSALLRSVSCIKLNNRK